MSKEYFLIWEICSDISGILLCPGTIKLSKSDLFHNGVVHGIFRISYIE